MTNSSVYTVGSTLRMAENDGHAVTVLVDGQWFGGDIVGMDGDGVLLRTETDQTMIRLAAISVVKIHASGVAPTLPGTAHGTVAPVVQLALAPAQPAVETVTATADEAAAVAVEPADAGDAAESTSGHSVVDEILSGAALAKLPVPAILADLPDDLTEAERQAVLRRRAEMAAGETRLDTDDEQALDDAVVGLALTEGQQIEEFGFTQLDDDAEQAAPEPALELVPDLVPDAEPTTVEAADLAAETVASEPLESVAAESETVEPETVEPETVESDVVEAATEQANGSETALQSSTQSDDWRAMLISLRQQAQAPISEPEKRKWRIAR